MIQFTFTHVNLFSDKLIFYFQIKISVKRKRHEFGAPCKFTDRNVADAKDGFIDCLSYEDKTFELKKAEHDQCVQVSGLIMID